jgi:hypothetical protein
MLDIDSNHNRPNKMTGRPSTYTTAAGDAICDGIRMGLSFDSAARSIGIAKSTAQGWLDRFPTFSANVDEAIGECEQALLEKIANSVRTGCKTTVTKSREAEQGGFEEITITVDDGVPSAKWLLPRINPERWSERAAIAKMVEDKSRREVEAKILYLMGCVSDSAKTEIANALMATGFEVSAANAGVRSPLPS